jgi:uncharacterized ferritin-like protein (DUF455 family)
MDIHSAALACVLADTIDAKLVLTNQTAAAFARGDLAVRNDATPPEPIASPGRPSRPLLVAPRDTKARGLGSDEGRAAFLHAIAHIEFNAIDLAWDAVYRFRDIT